MYYQLDLNCEENGTNFKLDYYEQIDNKMQVVLNTEIDILKKIVGAHQQFANPNVNIGETTIF